MSDKLDPCFISLDQEKLSALIPDRLNDPFTVPAPKICRIAADDLCEYISAHQGEWQQNFGFSADKSGPVKGKMFGVLVVKDEHGRLGYLATFSGKFAGASHPALFVPSLFDVSTNNHFITKGMRELSALGKEISTLERQEDEEAKLSVVALRQKRKEKSQRLQEELFSHYIFLNRKGEKKALVDIFKDYNGLNPPSAAGECAAPKLVQYAFQNKMKPLAIAEFWWGKTAKPIERRHRHFYPACENKCRPILGFMVGESG